MGQNPFDNQQNNNPWGQQQGSGGFSQQENPFGQQQGGFQQQYGGPSGFNQPMEPQKRGGGAGRACLIVFGLIFVCIVICCGAVAFAALSYHPLAPSIAWITYASAGSETELNGVVCEGSQAADFTSEFLLEHPDITSLNFTDGAMDGNTMTLYGEITDSGSTETLNLEFVVDPDGEGDLNFGFVNFGCVENIREVEAP